MTESNHQGDMRARGLALADEGRHADAIAVFESAIKAGETSLRFDLGNSLAYLGRWQEAAEQLRISAESGETDAWFNLGRALEALGEEAAAADAYLHAADAGDHMGSLGLALAARRAGDPDNARAHLRDASTAPSPDIQALAGAIQAVWEWDDTSNPELEARLRESVDLYTPATAALGELLIATDRTEDARRFLEERCFDGDPDACLPLGSLLDTVGDAKAAERAYRQGILNGDANCRLNLGLMLVRRGARHRGEKLIRESASRGDRLAIDYLARGDAAGEE